MITLQIAEGLVAQAIEMARTQYKRPICVAVVDEYGFLVAFGRMDGAPVRSIEISKGKAYTAARMGVHTEAFLERLHRENIPAIYFCDDKLTALPGGCVLKDTAGKTIGASGISGLAPSEDQAIAHMMADAVAARS
jgi:glc operon protein GlcG